MIAIPCQTCGREMAAGYGAECGDCRPGGWEANEPRIPHFDPADCVPMNDAARDAQANKSGPPAPPQERLSASERIERLLAGD